jgi:hypothetical protein
MCLFCMILPVNIQYFHNYCYLIWVVETPSVYCDVRAPYLHISYMYLVLHYVTLLVACLSPRVLRFRHGKYGGQSDTETGLSDTETGLSDTETGLSQSI